MNSKLRVALQILIGLIVLFAYAYAVMESGYTLASPVPVWIISAVMALLLSVLLRRVWIPLTDIRNNIVNILLGAVVLTGLSAALFYGVNTAFPSESVRERGVIVKKYSRVRHRTKRVGRRSYTSGEEYHTYHIEVSCEGHDPLEWELPVGKYAKAREGDTVTYEVCTGFFGLKTVAPSSLRILERKKRRPHVEIYGRRKIPS